MLTIDELRKSLGRPDPSDEEVEKVCNMLYTLASMLIDGYRLKHQYCHG